jgi:hypothetical protein
MFTWPAYFELVAALLGIYGVFRVVIWIQFRRDFQPLPPSKLANYKGQAIDPSHLAERLREVRRDYTAAVRKQPSSFKRPGLVKSKREQFAKLAFFQRPPPEQETPDQEHSSLLLLSM